MNEDSVVTLGSFCTCETLLYKDQVFFTWLCDIFDECPRRLFVLDGSLDVGITLLGTELACKHLTDRA